MKEKGKPNGTKQKTELRGDGGSLGRQLTLSPSVHRGPVCMRQSLDSQGCPSDVSDGTRRELQRTGNLNINVDHTPLFILTADRINICHMFHHTSQLTSAQKSVLITQDNNNRRIPFNKHRFIVNLY